MESARAGNEEPYFGQAAANNEVVQTRTDISTIPGQSTGGGWHSNTSSSVSKLDALTHKAGPNVLLKVMAGDQINATASYYYQDPVTNGTGNNLTTSIVTALAQTILGSPVTTTIDKGNTTPISTELNADQDFISKTAPDANDSTGNLPKAYLTVVFFNERFEYVSEGSMAVRVAAAGDGQAPLVIPNVKAPKNGYAYVYLSNESNEPVYFDDFKVADTRGRIIEENHYYAFGLKIAGISSVKMGDPNEGSLKNNNLYNDKELWDDADLNWYDYGFRNYDPQIGRFPQLDPLTDDYPGLTNYQYASNDPILNIDLDGLEGVPTPGGIWNGSFLEQGGKLAGSGSRALLNTIVTQSVKLTTNVAEHKAEDALINKALQGGVKRVGGALLKGLGLTIYLTFKPVETGKEFTPREMYERFWYMFKPKKPEENDDREHEQYVLRANSTGYYPIMKWGYKDPVGTVKLKRGEVWKYGTTVNPDSRYSQIWLRKMNLRKFPEETGSAPYVLAQEGIKIIKYFIEYGKLPPGNKMFK